MECSLDSRMGVLWRDEVGMCEGVLRRDEVGMCVWGV